MAVQQASTGELKALYKRKILYKVNWWCWANLSVYPGGGIAGYNCIWKSINTNEMSPVPVDQSSVASAARVWQEWRSLWKHCLWADRWRSTGGSHRGRHTLTRGSSLGRPGSLALLVAWSNLSWGQTKQSIISCHIQSVTKKKSQSIISNKSHSIYHKKAHSQSLALSQIQSVTRKNS